MRRIAGTLRNGKGGEGPVRLMSVLGTWKHRAEDPSSKLYAPLS